MHRFALTAIAIAVASLAAGGPADAASIVGLMPENRLIVFDSDKPGLAKTVRVAGAHGKILGIDVRPADRKLYAVTDADMIYTIDPATGAASPVSKLSVSFNGGAKAVVDFNPVADRLRLMGLNGVNFRVHPDTGAVTTDGALAFAANDRNAGKKPAVAAGAYTNSMTGARETALYNIDPAMGALLLQSPPNDGVQQTKGSLGLKLKPTVAFDIMADSTGRNVAYALADKTLYTVDLASGKATRLRDIKKLPALIDIAVLPAK